MQNQKRWTLNLGTIAINIVILIFILRELDLFKTAQQIYPGNPDTTVPEYNNGSLITITNGGRPVYAYYVPGSGPLIVYFHGNKNTISDFKQELTKLSSEGHALLLVEYAGTGLASKIKPAESSIVSDSEKMIKTVQKTFSISTQNTILMGYSLGTGIAAHLARKNVASRLVLIAPFTSLLDMAPKELPHPLVLLTTKSTYNTMATVKKLGIPVLIIHGQLDKKIPYEMGVSLQKAARNAQLVSVPDADHGVMERIDESAVWTNLAIFLKP